MFVALRAREKNGYASSNNNNCVNFDLHTYISFLVWFFFFFLLVFLFILVYYGCQKCTLLCESFNKIFFLYNFFFLFRDVFVCRARWLNENSQSVQSKRQPTKKKMIVIWCKTHKKLIIIINENNEEPESNVPNYSSNSNLVRMKTMNANMSE